MNQARRDTSHDSALVETVDLAKAIGLAKVHRAFLDPLGAHLVLSLKPTDPEAQPDLLYLNRYVVGLINFHPTLKDWSPSCPFNLLVINRLPPNLS